MLQHLRSRIHSLSTRIPMAYYASGIPGTGFFSLPGTWIGGCFLCPVCMFLLCHLLQNVNFILITVIRHSSSKRSDFAFSLLQWHKTGYLNIYLSAFLPVESAFLPVQCGIGPTEYTHRNVEHSCSWQDKVSVKVNLLSVFMDVCSKNWTSVGH